MKKSGLWILLLVILALLLRGSQAFNKAKDAANSAIDTVGDVADGVADVAGDAVDGAADLAGDAADAVVDGAEAVVDGAADVVEGAADVAGDAVDGAADLAGDAADAVADGAEAVVDGAADVVEGAADAVADGAEAVADAVDGEEVPAEAPADAGDTVGLYDSYSAVKLAKAVEDGKKVAVFFHGATCGSCAKLDADIKENVAAIPGDVVVFNADWDDNQDLATEWDVAKYHTVTMVTNDATNVAGLFTLEDLIAEL